MRKRSTYRPRPVLANPVALAIKLSGKLPPADQQRLKAIVGAALDAMRTGSRDAHAAWCQLADAFNIGEALAELGICSDASLIRAGQLALSVVHARHAERGSWTLRATELHALTEAVWLHGVQLEHCSKGEFEQAHQRTAERMRQARAGNAPRDAIVCVGAFSP